MVGNDAADTRRWAWPFARLCVFNGTLVRPAPPLRHECLQRGRINTFIARRRSSTHAFEGVLVAVRVCCKNGCFACLRARVFCVFNFRGSDRCPGCGRFGALGARVYSPPLIFNSVRVHGHPTYRFRAVRTSWLCWPVKLARGAVTTALRMPLPVLYANMLVYGCVRLCARDWHGGTTQQPTLTFWRYRF